MEKGILIEPETVALIVLDYQQDFLASLSKPARKSLDESMTALASIATACSIPVVLSGLVSDAFTGQTWPRLQQLIPDHRTIDRSRINCWEDPNFTDVIRNLKKNRLLFAGLWTETGVSFGALSALAHGYDVFLVTNAAAGMSVTSHETAIQRMVQAGVVPVTWCQLLFEWYRVLSGKDSNIGQSLITIARQRGYLLPDEH